MAILTEDQMDAMDSPSGMFGMPPPPAEAIRAEITRESMAILEQPMKACAVCDRYLRVLDHPIVKLPKDLPDTVWSSLEPPTADDGYGKLDYLLRDQYNVQKHFKKDVVGDDLYHKLGSVLLSDNGLCESLPIISEDTNEDLASSTPMALRICPKCWRSLQKSNRSASEKTKSTPPKHAIANGNFPGWVDDWVWGKDNGNDSSKGKIHNHDTFGSKMEWSLVSPAQTMGKFTTLKGGGQQALRGQTFSMRLNVDEVLKKLPIAPANSSSRALLFSAVVTTGKCDPVKARRVVQKDFQRFVCSRGNVQRLATTRIKHNRLFKDFSLDDEILTSLSTQPELPEGAVHVTVDKNMTNPEPKHLLDQASLEHDTIRLGDGEQRRAGDADDAAAELVRDQLGDTYQVRTEDEYCSVGESDYMENNFARNFPFGRGGFGEYRKVPMSRQSIIKNYARLSHGDFQSPGYVLPAWSLVGSMEMNGQAFVTAKMKDGNSVKGEEYAKLTKSDFKLATKYLEQKAAAARHFRPTPPLPPHAKEAALDFFRSVQICSSRQVSNAERTMMDRSESFALMHTMGKPTWWITLALDDVNSIDIWEIGTGDRPSNAPRRRARFTLLAQQPGAAALSYEKMIDVFLQVVLGWDISRNAPTAKGGVFGHTRAWALSTEGQGRGSLHGHALVWIAGHSNLLERLQNIYSQRETSSGAETWSVALDSMSVHLQTLLSTDLDLKKEEVETMLTCPECASELTAISKKEIDLLQLRPKAHLSRKKTSEEGKTTPDESQDPCVVKCSSCEFKCGAYKCLKQALNNGFQETSQQNPYPLPGARAHDSTEQLDDLKWKRIKMPSNSDNPMQMDIFRLQRASVLLSTLFHDPRHRPPCFKKGDRCKYKSPEVANPEPTTVSLDEDAEVFAFVIRVERKAPFVYISSTNLELGAIFQCNSHVKYVHSFDVGCYINNYYLKSNKEGLDSFQEGYNNVLRHIDTHQSTDRTEYSLGLGRLISAVKGHTRGEIICSQMAAWLLAGHKPFETSHKVVPLCVNQGIAFLKGERLLGKVISKGIILSSVHHYIYRPEDMEDLCWWDYIRFYDVLPNAEVDMQHRLSLLKRHPQTKTHSVVLRLHAAIPRMTGGKLPNTTCEKDPSLEGLEQAKTYRTKVLVMMTPWRAESMMLSGDIEDVYDSTTIEPNHRRILGNMQQHYSSFIRQENGSLDEEEDEENLLGCGAKSDEPKEADIVIDDIDTLAIKHKTMRERTETAKRLQRDGTDFEVVKFTSEVQAEYNNVNFHMARQQMKRESKETFSLHRKQPAPEEDSSTPKRRRAKISIDTVVNLTELALLDVKFQNHIWVNDRLNKPRDDPFVSARIAVADRPSINEHSKLWLLNELQHEAFVIIAEQIIECVRLRHNLVSSESKEDDQGNVRVKKAVLFALIGMGGSGKSVVIEAITQFARRWHVPDLVVVTATSGNAASLIKGFTWESTVKHNAKSPGGDTPRPDVVDAWRSVGLLVVDEISMMSRADLGLLSRKLQLIKDDDRPFGGISVLLAGDFYQLAPVLSTPMFRSTLTEGSPSADNTNGYEVWKDQLTHAVVLRENVRQQGDEGFANALFRFRLSCPKQLDIDLINDRVLSPIRKLKAKKNARHICGGNIERAAINDFAFIKHCRKNPLEDGHDWTHQGALRILMQYTSDSSSRTFDEKLGKYLRNQTAAFYDYKMEGHLDAIVGGPVQVKQNFAVDKGVSNGTSATLMRIILAPGAEPFLTETTLGGVTAKFYAIGAEHVEGIILKHTNRSRQADQLYHGLPKGCFPMFLNSGKTGTIKKKINIKDLEFWVNCRQFKLVPAWAITGHAAQGQTITTGVALCKKSTSAGWVYVVLSRVKARQEIVLYHRLKDAKFYKRRADVDKAMTHIFKLERQVLTERLGEEKAKQIYEGTTIEYAHFNELMRSCTVINPNDSCQDVDDIAMTCPVSLANTASAPTAPPGKGKKAKRNKKRSCNTSGQTHTKRRNSNQ